MQNKIINNSKFDKNIRERISEVDRIFEIENRERIRRGDVEKFNQIAHTVVFGSKNFAE